MTNARPKYEAIEKAREILKRAEEGGLFADLWSLPRDRSIVEVEARAEALLGEEFADVEPHAMWALEEVEVVPRFNYRPQGRASAASWLPEEAA